MPSGLMSRRGFFASVICSRGIHSSAPSNARCWALVTSNSREGTAGALLVRRWRVPLGLRALADRRGLPGAALAAGRAARALAGLRPAAGLRVLTLSLAAVGLDIGTSWVG